jgi:phosphoribosylformylglycinamidine (FGAM) synthase-like enzyme
MSITVAQVEAITAQLTGLLALVSPQAGAVITGVEALAKLFKTGTEFNGLLKDIMEQTDVNADEVMAQVIADYKASSAAVRAKLDAIQ